MRSSSTLLVSFILVSTAVVALGPGCGTSGSEFPNEPDGSLTDDGGRFGDAAWDDAGRPCTTGLCLKRVSCPNGGDTTVTGVVYDPAGKVPLYNAFVFVPNAKLETIGTGASCDRCDSGSSVYSGDPVTSAQTDAAGRFTLRNVPVDAKIPLVVQIGKWRREKVTISVEACKETKLTDKELTRLPKNQNEGNIPLIAITTGGADSLECLPRRMGIDDSEFSTKGGKGRIHLYKGDDLINQDPSKSAFSRKQFNDGTPFKGSTELWNTTAQLKAYDMVLLSCEGTINPSSKKEPARKALYEYESMGGRVFASHWHRYWFSDGPDPVPSIATGGKNNGWVKDSNDEWSNGGWKDNIQSDDMQVAVVNESFPKGKAFADWLQNVGGTTTRGNLEITAPRDNLNAVDRSKAQDWATIPTYSVKKENGEMVAASPAAAVQFTSYNAPIGKPAEACGRAVFTDLHVSSGARDDQAGKAVSFPGGCQDADLSEQEKALEFMLFDLASCVSNDTDPPPPPVH